MDRASPSGGEGGRFESCITRIIKRMLSDLFILFVFYSSLGWMCEVCYCALITHRFVNRGFLHGPWCPVYGIGALSVIGLLQPFAHNVFLLYAASFFITGAVEYLTGWLLEMLFHTKWWDYSDKKFNIKGRVCLFNSLLFTFASGSAVLFVHPTVAAFVERMSSTLRFYIACAFGFVFTADFVLTLRKVVDFTEYITRLQDFAENLKERYENEAWFKSQSVSDMFEAVKLRSRLAKGEISDRILAKIELFSQRHAAVERFFNKFPSMQNTNRSFSLQHIKKLIQERMQDKKNKLWKN